MYSVDRVSLARWACLRTSSYPRATTFHPAAAMKSQPNADAEIKRPKRKLAPVILSLQSRGPVAIRQKKVSLARLS